MAHRIGHGRKRRSKCELNDITITCSNTKRRCKTSKDEWLEPIQAPSFGQTREGRRLSRFSEEDTDRSKVACSGYKSNQRLRNSNRHTVIIEESSKPHQVPKAPVSSPSVSSGSSSDAESSNCKRIAFLETYVKTLKGQLSYKDKKLHRLQRQSPKFSEDNKDAILQTAWDQHNELYKKFQILEEKKKLLRDKKESLEHLVNELQAKVGHCDKEKVAAEKTVVSLQNVTAEMQLLKSENETLKHHYETEVSKKLKEYQQQCFDYVTSHYLPFDINSFEYPSSISKPNKMTIRAYQIKMRTLQVLLWQSQMGMGRPMVMDLGLSSIGSSCENSTPPTEMNIKLQSSVEFE